MEIKNKAQSSLINQVASETTPASPAASSAPKTSSGLGAVKDGFEARKPDPFGSLVATTPAKNPLAAKFQESKSEIAGFIGGQGVAGGGFPATDGLFGAMLAYQKMMNKDAREDKKLARADSKL